MNQATLRGGEFRVTRGIPRLGPPCTLGCLVRRGDERSPEEEVLSDGLMGCGFSEETSSPGREHVWPRAPDSLKLPFWVFLPSRCLRRRAGSSAVQTLPGHSARRGQTVWLPLPLLSWGGEQQDNGAEKRKCHSPLSKDSAVRWPGAGPLAGLWLEEEDSAFVIQQVPGCSP